MRTRSIFLVAIIIVAFAAVFIYREYNRVNVPMQNMEPAFKVNADALMKEFTTADSVASKKYSGNVIEVSGTVKSLSDDSSTITLGNADALSSIICSLDSSVLKTELPATNTAATIRGSFNGFNKDELLGTDLIMNRCIIIK
jgi:tRNA_anti-like